MTSPPVAYVTDRAGTAPLAGLRVVDFTRVLSGPWCTLCLSDLGADVIKIEDPRGGDDSRNFGRLGQFDNESAYFLFANRNKRSVALDIGTAEGQRVVRRMAQQVDVLIENFRPGVMQRHGLDYPSLAGLNGRLVYCSISGYGHDSPLREVAGYDPIVQAESGMMSITGEPHGEPMRTGISFADMFAGMFAVQAVLAALRVRDRDGVGQFIDLALLDSAVAVMANVAQTYLLTGKIQQRAGNRNPFLEPFGTFDAADGPVSLVVGNERQWRRFCLEVIERADVLADARFATNEARVKHSAELRSLIQTLLGARTREHWIGCCRRAGVPIGAIRTVGEALDAAEVLYRGMVGKLSHPSAGSMRYVASPIRYSVSALAAPRPAPRLGEHTSGVLAEFGYGDDELERLRASGAIP
ncbi:MAG: CoA transferase [Burkholderiales bacterium]|nr:CoA transferase [Burkholderiales bacterium]